MNLYLAVGVVLVAVFAVASSVLIEQFCRGPSIFSILLQAVVAAHAIWKRRVINRQMSLIVYVSRSRL